MYLHEVLVFCILLLAFTTSSYVVVVLDGYSCLMCTHPVFGINLAIRPLTGLHEVLECIYTKCLCFVYVCIALQCCIAVYAWITRSA